VFQNQVEKAPWYDIPFAYLPWWEKRAPALPRNAVTAWGFEHLAKYLAPCTCGGTPVQIEGGSPKTYRYYCSNIHGDCKVTTKECESMPEAVHDWNIIQGEHGYDLRLLHPLNR
jgi:hypothetical protein